HPKSPLLELGLHPSVAARYPSNVAAHARLLPFFHNQVQIVTVIHGARDLTATDHQPWDDL
ncbi:MAG: hypothetical protein KZQ81_13690, partial [Candidatus Thiodiazotropha sp. (ex Rostrolucina anterorostrata)]|nr:hypothetical protein [Candidatus Thiodiazotropha sp. (ex Rostrolucina anterorostrata)]